MPIHRERLREYLQKQVGAVEIMTSVWVSTEKVTYDDLYYSMYDTIGRMDELRMSENTSVNMSLIVTEIPENGWINYYDLKNEDAFEELVCRLPEMKMLKGLDV